jgi:hypothetical protein
VLVEAKGTFERGIAGDDPTLIGKARDPRQKTRQVRAVNLGDVAGCLRVGPTGR